MDAVKNLGMVGQADSSLWWDLGEKFRALQETHGMLRADWDYIVGSGRGEYKLVGTAGRTIEFETLAKRAASALSDAGSSDLLIVWLEVLKSKSGRFEYGRSGTEPNADGSGEVEHLTGAIFRVCEASADYCSKLEGEALEAEFRESRQDALPTRDAKASEIEQFSADSVGHQIDQLREECRMTVEDLAEKMGVSPRTVQRHIAGVCDPLARNLIAYERVFSKALNKQVLIKKMS